MKSVLSDAKQVEIAVDLVKLGARMQVLDVETTLSRERLLRLYKEIRGVSPPKGMLPFSTDWFMTWMPNIHASIFLDTHKFIGANTPLKSIEVQIKSYKLYLEHLQVNGLECALSFTRAWSLIRFVQANLLDTARCTECSGQFVVHKMDLHRHYVCGLCHVPSRAGKTLRDKEARESAIPEATRDAIRERELAARIKVATSAQGFALGAALAPHAAITAKPDRATIKA